MDRSEMLELMAATGSGRNDDGAGRLGVHLLHERRRDLQREIVFPFEGAECAGHSAAARIENGGGSSGQTSREPGHESRLYERFCVAMRVNCDVTGFVIETERGRLFLQQLLHELLEEMRAFRDRLRLG